MLESDLNIHYDILTILVAFQIVLFILVVKRVTVNKGKNSRIILPILVSTFIASMFLFLKLVIE
ncbi:hypothetical protein COF68_06215 [Bacillus toyonensis]|uniref:hypothetical protein n=1 Tax=Bacillus toyonensis TaxID=155322 RepID=UPI000BFB88F0|nr:hypothetical protein [Bacillus toyonensis]PHE64428.1 hypothetical protein COF68_06215 [Bacillus toyonensis]